MPEQRSFFRWLPPLCWMVIIFTASTDMFSGAHTGALIVPFLRWLLPHATRERVEFIHFCIRKCAHLTEYGILGVLLWRAVPERPHSPGAADWLRAFICLGVATAYAATDEYHQSFVPSRTSAVHDVVIDACGAMVGLIVICTVSVRRARRQELAPAVAAE